MAEALFRDEVIAARAARLHGKIVITSTLSAWLVTGFVALVAAGALAWATLATYARTETVRGVISPVSPLAKLVAPRPGLVTQLDVAEGDLVRAGQTLALVRIDQPTERDAAPAASSLAAIDAQRRLAENQLALEPGRIATERARLSATATAARRQAAEMREQLGFQAEMIKSARDSFTQIRDVVAAGYVTRLEYERRRQAWLTAEQQRRSIQQQIDQAEGAAAAAEAERARLPIDSASATAQLQATVEQLAQARAQQTAQAGYAVTAPLAGRVTSLQAAVGRFADGRVPLMTIVPEATRMRAELYAPSRSMGFLAAGQGVRLLYDAFPYQRFGSFGGHVSRIGRAVIGPQELDVPLDIREPVYRVVVDLDRQTIPAARGDIPLQAGMTLTGNVVLERRSFVDWLLDPLRALRARS